MCMLTFLPPGATAPGEALWNGSTFNRDGHGYAIVIPGDDRLVVRHGLKADEMIERFMADRVKYPAGPALFHSRFGTSGSGGKYNCHPFYVGGDKRTVVAHNGVLPTDMQPGEKDKRCDTRLAADEIFPKRYGHLSSPMARKLLGKDIGAANKLVILTTNPDYPSSAYVINENSGIWDEGVWYSNSDYCGWVFPTAVEHDDEWGILGREELCPVCKGWDCINEQAQVCTLCMSCLDCFEVTGECVCRIPAWTYFEEGEGA